MGKPKPEIITFKVDNELSEAMRGIPNRSQFIRSAVLAALDNTCPLCRGVGVLTPKQREHWNEFARTHSVTECAECHEYYLQCSAEG
ncbi:MAG TPA: ribbon-helix-helix domain-containing protein [Candidatus Hydrogenedentes bacterium]|mgnify:CR=1 FL=1|nr:ribbon-helix-helix domain-containing protein [Candidatus Hydrogenedentota bacterium]HPG66754.1 ribbon-helix-helix domain-containing protein [Candidatus Hydrogenedentota bacterium]